MKKLPTPDETLQDLVGKLGDWRWRMNNLYSVRDERGVKVPFKLNETQEELSQELWYLTIVPKARQLGMCLHPDTKVLTADLRWIKIGDMHPGMEIVSVDEYPPSQHQSRRMKKGVVEGVVRFKRQTYKIFFDDGTSIICTGKHPWLAQKAGVEWQWMTLDGIPNKRGWGKKKDQLLVGSKIRRVTRPWGDMDYEDGWVSGMLDGEGSLAKKSRCGANIGIAQVDGPVWERLVRYFENRGYHYRTEVDKRKGGESSKFGNKPVNKMVLSRMDEIFRLIGQTRPSRFIERDWWVGREIPYLSGDKFATIIKIEDCGEQEVVDLQTSEGTYIAEGLVSHNTTFFTLFYLDQVLFSNDKIAGIIAHREEDMKKIFRTKILFALEHLDPAVKAYIGEPKIATSNELVFPNGGSIFVSLSTRSGTVNFLHISEYGYICAHAPEKADEILNGAINSVHAGQMVSIESTAEGRQGHFYRLVMEAEKARKQGKHLTPLDFKILFYPWWRDKRYVLSDDDSLQTNISVEDKEYFDALRTKHGIFLTKNQMAWYVKKKALLGEGIYQEFPSSLEESFMESLEGAYYAKEMGKVYQEKRIGFFPVDPLQEVHTSWDLGMNDLNTIIFFQEIGAEVRIVDYYEDSGYSLEHYVKYLQDKGYRYGRHLLPHDATVRDLSAVGGITRQQVLWDLGLRNTEVVSKIGIQDGIEKVRQIFPRLRFNESTTKAFTDHLANYRRDYDKGLGVWKNTPRHDKSSHGADCLRNLAVSYQELSFLPDGWSPEQSVNIQTFDFS